MSFHLYGHSGIHDLAQRGPLYDPIYNCVTIVSGRTDTPSSGQVERLRGWLGPDRLSRLGSKRIPTMLCIAVIALRRSSALLSHLPSICSVSA